LAASDPANRISLVDWISGPQADYGIDSMLLQNAVLKAEANGFMESLLLVRDGILVSENYFRGHDATTEFDISYATQGITALLTGIALHEGIISSLDERVLDYFPEYDSLITDENKQLITLEHLLLNTSGFPADEDTLIGSIFTVKELLVSKSDWWQYILGLPLTSLPGTRYALSPLSSHLLAGIISRASDMTIKAFAEQHLFGPLGIDINMWEADPSENYCGGWGLHLTTRAMAKIGDLLQSGMVIDGERLCSAEYLEASLRPYSRTGVFDPYMRNMSYGYLWTIAEINHFEVYYAQGYAGQLIMNLPVLGLTLVTSTQQDINTNVAYYQIRNIYSLIARDILPAVLGEDVPLPYPPDNLISSIESNQSLAMREVIHWLRWEPDARNSEENITAYRIYDYFMEGSSIVKRQIGEVAGNNPYFYVRGILHHPEITYGPAGITYGVAAVNDVGLVGAPQITAPGNPPE
jgi:CubicO group peptidase (beta-lactamase class C family)